MIATAEQVIAKLQDYGWPVGRSAPWGVEAVYVTDTTYVNSIDMHIDGDYLHWYLVEVCDKDPDAAERYIHGELQPATDGETWVTYLAVFIAHTGEDLHDRIYEWHPSRKRFFDRESAPTTADIRHWFVDWAERRR